VGEGAVIRRAAEALGRELQAGEHVAGSAVMTSDPSRWAVVVFLAPVAALLAAGLASFAGAGYGPVAAGLGVCLLGLGIEFLPRPMVVAVTSQRLLCWRLSRLRRAPRRLVFAVPLAELHVVRYRPGRYASSIQCELSGTKRIRLAAGRAGRKDFAKVEEVLARSGAFAQLDPPWPSAAKS
jgi:hypothetical protein